MSISGPGVYLWKNRVNNKIYVGSSLNIRRRKAEHILRLNKGVENSEYFQRAWDKYGQDNFEFSILEVCLAEFLLVREQHWIDKLKAMNEEFGYNLIPTRKSQLYGDALSKHQRRGWAKYTPEQRKKLNLHLNRPAAKARALARSNEVKKLQPWRDAMEKSAWSKLRKRWNDPVWRKMIIAKQNEGRRLAKLRRESDDQ